MQQFGGIVQLGFFEVEGFFLGAHSIALPPRGLFSWESTVEYGPDVPEEEGGKT
jgi:hypothetical protein